MTILRNNMKKDFSHLEAYRSVDGPFATSPGSTFGAFAIPHETIKGEKYLCVVDDGTGPKQQQWECVMVRAVAIVDPEKKTVGCRPLTWDDMDEMKRMFWDEDEVVIQIHHGKPDKSSNTAGQLYRLRVGNIMVPTKPQPETETQKTE